MEAFLFQSTIYLMAACLAVPIAVRFGLGSVLGYLLAGIIIGPVAGLVGSETKDLQHFAEFGVVMMLFLIGLELEPRALWDMRHRLLGLGGLQVVLTGVLITLAALALDQTWPVAVAIGLSLSLSSTAIVLQTLNEKQLMGTPGGRSAFSVLLTQDIAVIPMLAVLPLLALSAGTGLTVADYGVTSDLAEKAHDAHGGGAHAESVMSLIETLPAWGVTAVTVGAVIVIVLGGHYLTHSIFRYIHLSKLREMYTAAALLFVVGVSALMMLVGLSPALGAFLAGVVLANSEFRHELEADLEPFKGLLLGLFFITVGAGINFALLAAEPLKIIGITIVVMVSKYIVLLCLALVFRIKGRDRVLFTLGLAQAGEFGFVLITFAVQQHIFTVDLSQTLLLVVALSMLLTPLLFILYEQLQKRMRDHAPDHTPDEIDEQNAIIIAGVGRFGQVVNRLVQHSGYKTTVLDHDLKKIQLMRRFGFKGFLGDPTRPDLLHSAGLETARVLVVALDNPDAALQLTKYARKTRPDLKIIARAHDRTHSYALYAAGADHIVRELFDAALRAGRYALEEMGLPEHDAHEQEVAFYRTDRAAMAELARLWDPDIPVEKNEAYIARAREMNKELETALVEALDTPADPAAISEDDKRE
ncbi:MAG: monovalent cation:proton antiporter-2 (CPA2) family protein [Pseudomonadota bacterium]